MKLRRFSTKPSRIASNAINVLGNAFQHAAWFEDESGQRHPAEVGTGTELADDVHEYWGKEASQLAVTQFFDILGLVKAD
jgi:hypothetical protein